MLLGLYASACLFLYVRQRQLIYRPSAVRSLSPNAPDFGMPYEDVWISVESETIHAWWIPADEKKQFIVLENEPSHLFQKSKVMLYFCGVGNNMGDYNYLSRVAAFRQLGFSVLTFDYRGYGHSSGDFPNEQQLYADGEAVWQYLRDEREVAAEDIVIYGESMGGAIALHTALNHPNADALILQSTFTTMAEAISYRPITSLFPIEQILSERFDSLGKIAAVEIPVLFIHGEEDSVVPVQMSQALYEATPGRKQIWRIPNADHVSIYRPEVSYLKVIDTFMKSLEEGQSSRPTIENRGYRNQTH